MEYYLKNFHLDLYWLNCLFHPLITLLKRTLNYLQYNKKIKYFHKNYLQKMVLNILSNPVSLYF